MGEALIRTVRQTNARAAAIANERRREEAAGKITEGSDVSFTMGSVTKRGKVVGFRDGFALVKAPGSRNPYLLNPEDLTVHEGKTGESEMIESETYPFLPGTYEELREQLRQGATKTLGELSAGLAYVEVMGTWSDRAVATAYQVDGKALTYEFDYALRGDEVELGEPVPVELKVSVDGQEEDGQGLLPYPAVIDDVALDLKVMFQHAEIKAGRVLSAVNEKRLLAAVESLVAVLKAAGLEVDASARVKQEEEENDQKRDATQYQDSTAPSARSVAGEGKVLLDSELLARGYRLIGDAHAMT